MNAIVNTQNTQLQDDIIDINISGIKRKRIRINGDDNKILLLNTSDLNISYRLSEAYPKLKALEEEFKNIPDSKNENIEELTDIASKLKNIDDKMREQMDYIFDSNVSEVCCDGGSMYDPINGYARYELIFDSLSSLYAESLKNEKKRIENRIKQHTSKYIKK